MAKNNPYALSFNGNTNYIDMGTNKLNDFNEITMEAWVYSAGNYYTYRTILANRVSGSNSCRFEMYLNMSSGGFGFFNGTQYNTTYTPIANTWVHLAITLDASKKLTFYANGQVVHSFNNVVLGANSISNSLTIGNAHGRSEFFGGKLDEIRVWSRARTQDEIKETMKAKLSGSEDDLVAYWRLDEGSGTTIIDSSISGLTGTMYGATWISGEIDLNTLGKMLMRVGSSYYYLDENSTWTLLGHNPTAQDFEDLGVNEINGTQLRDFESNYGKQYRVYMWNDGEQFKTGKLKAIPQNTSAIQVTDAQLFGVDKLDSVTVNATGNGCIAISVDNGVAWMSYSGGQWNTVSNISQGMTFAEFNALTSQQLEDLRGDSNTIRFAYYLTGDTVIDKIEIRVTLTGIPAFANKSDYNMNYDPTTKTITYVINKSGRYIANYTNT